ncbi:four helix bundle protein [Geminocystis herdmanii]|uniref:four helix bundle protein n=1 Tax=Geminocystis herdmanii TaxID=669359 RepID=UPI00058BD3A5|nr:four helix bundle protein [Geminocystis herdmanii]
MSHEDLIVYQKAFETAMTIFYLSKKFPVEEKYSLTDQIRRSSRSVCANLAEAWRKRRYKAAFIAKLNDCEGEAAETQVWLNFCLKCSYITESQRNELYDNYNKILSGIVKMINNPEHWLINKT